MSKASMQTHASIWRFRGDPDELVSRHAAMITEVPPAQMRLHLCLRAPDGILLVDTCPSHEAFVAFSESDAFRDLRARHGLPEPEHVEDFPVEALVVEGVQREQETFA